MKEKKVSKLELTEIVRKIVKESLASKDTQKQQSKKLSVDQLQEMVRASITEVLKEEMGGFGPEETPEDIAKDKLQTAFLDNAKPFLHHYYRKLGMDQKAAAGKTHEKFLELEELIVDAMMQFNL